ncbi:BTAD domain-containing putative transcriptional regulator [Amycolatopsis sp. cg5]|uniref:AfsR/SARP family transcriptional regulator n=1 Tax=Amycolatopsis sp. cg5 TaxID=3238802 RepID=UPI0035240045
MAELRIELLGPIRAWQGTSELPLGPARQRALFATLALRAGHTVTREQLICAVWGTDEAPPTASGSVHTYISNLRRILDRSVLTGGRGGYTLRVPPGSIDSIAFEHLVNRGAPNEALALWHGDPLSGMRGQFAEQQRSRLTELRLKAIELHAERLLSQGDYRDLTTSLTALAREHPLRERLRELLMLALDRDGRHAEALEVFRDARATLIAELGVEPGPALRTLHHRLLTGTRDPLPDLHFVAPARVASAFTGQIAPLARLRALISDRSGSVWLEGDVGVGKSALLAAALSGLGRRHLGWAHAAELSMPLQAMESCLGTADDPLSFVSRLCATAPVVLVLDDMHWADDATVLLWHRLVDMTRQLPLLLIASARLLPRSRELAQLRQRFDTVMTLDALSFSGTDALARVAALSFDAREILRWAALLDRFTVADISALTGKRPSDLLAAFEETLTAHVLSDHGAYLTFAHPALRSACREAIPLAFRSALLHEARSVSEWPRSWYRSAAETGQPRR